MRTSTSESPRLAPPELLQALAHGNMPLLCRFLDLIEREKVRPLVTGQTALEAVGQDQDRDKMDWKSLMK